MFLVARFRVLHAKKKLAGEFLAIAAVIEAMLIHSAIIKRTNFSGHHFLSPEC
jgi:hypothetical protein